jgi:hypothetical protein
MIGPVLVLTQCPGCGGRRLMPVATSEGTNFSCQDCRLCWHLARGWASLVDPQTCPGCQFGRRTCSDLREVSTRRNDVFSAVAVNGSRDSGPADDVGWSDIESELYSSAREAGVECSPLLS